jgi:DnaK suppressor protein
VIGAGKSWKNSKFRRGDETMVKRKRKIRKKGSKKKAPVKKAKKIPKKQLKEYRGLLIKQKELIVGEIQHITKDTLNKSPKDASGDISGYTYHIADLATDSYDREFSLGLASNEREVLYQINDALKRIEEGSFGKCLECGKSITKKRLKDIPHTKFCIKCQKIQESGEKPR